MRFAMQVLLVLTLLSCAEFALATISGTTAIRTIATTNITTSNNTANTTNGTMVPRTISTVLEVPTIQPFVPANNTTTSVSGQSTGTLRNILGLLLNSTNTSSTGDIIPSLISSSQLGANKEAVQYLLATGPYAYVLAEGNVQVVDTGKLKVVSTIKPSRKDAKIAAVAVSQDGKYVYTAEAWSEYYHDYGYETYLDYVNVVRINASNLQPMDYFKFDYMVPRHLAASPDGKVYLGAQDGSYPESGKLRVMDFAQGQSGYIDYKQLIMIYNFEFSPDGKMVYYSAWWDCPKIYEFDTAANKVKNYWLTNNCSDSYEYARTLALANGGKTLYTGIRGRNGIIAMNTQDKGMKLITADYSPLAMAVSKDGNTLYALGYITNSQDENVYFIHKYSGLQPIGAPYGGISDILVSTNKAFTYDSMSFVTTPEGAFPINLDVSEDGKYAFIATSTKQDAFNVGKGTIIYDLQYMNQVKILDAKVSQNDVAVSAEKIYFAPPVDIPWAMQYGKIGGVFGFANSTYAKKFYPEPNTYASHYKEDWFEVYAIFTDPVDNKTVNGSTFWLTEKSGPKVEGKVSAAGTIAMLMLNSQLKENTDYVAHLSKAIKSKDGKPLYADVEWNFTTRNTSEGTNYPNVTLNYSAIKALGLSNAFKLVPENATNASNQSILGKLGMKMPPVIVNVVDNKSQAPPQESANQSTQGISGNVEQTIEEARAATELNPQPEPPAPAQGEDVKQSIENAQQANQLNPQPEPPAPSQTGAADAKKAAQDAKQATQLNPQPEPPAPQKGIIESILEFFASLFGGK